MENCSFENKQEARAEQKQVVPARLWVMAFCDALEDLLEEFDITIPDDGRTEDDNEARLFGTSFDQFASVVTFLLQQFTEVVKLNPDAEYDFEQY